MIYDVKISNSMGEIKQVISGQELAKNYWDEFRMEEANKGMNFNGKSAFTKLPEENVQVEIIPVPK